MIAEFERYHGVALRDIIVCTGSLKIETCDLGGRVNCYKINNDVGLFIKHCANRLTPWTFTYDARQLVELNEAFKGCRSVWLAHICGDDGVMVISFSEFQQINPGDAETTCFVRVDKSRNTMYRVFGTGGELRARKRRGVGPIIDALTVSP